MPRLRTLILVCGLAQVAVSLTWFYMLRNRQPIPHLIVVTLLALFGVGYASIFTARTGKFRRSVVTIDWIIVILWAIVFVIAINELPEHRGMPWVMIGLLLGVIVPSVINGIAVILLKPPQAEPRIQPQVPR